ncbi:cellulose binding domain-containing protein [Streptomyces sp. NPDC052013]|uniref:cellulose binding domain-containing protein n=1 Tax=Streptomyces sp. NPDC052013 TaxID=3365679 RepID=UPI0037D03D10
MPDLPTPQDDAEAALFSECWDAVLSYAELCTAGSAAAAQLAREAFAHGVREVRAAESGTVRGTGRRSARLPRIPLLLTAVRTTAAEWEDTGQGHRLDPDLRLWLASEQAARHTGPPLARPVALRGLRDLQPADAELLWLAEVEALPLPLAARRLGLDPATAADELDRVREQFRNRCHRNHLDSPMDAECRSYARLLDAVTRSPAAHTPDDLDRHLAGCAQCAEAAACLRPPGAAAAEALADGVLGWGGLAYLERRRRASDARLGAGRHDGDGATGPDHDDPSSGTERKGIARSGLLVAAVLVSALALAVSLMPFGGDTPDERVAHPGTDRRPVSGPGASLPPDAFPDTPSATASASAGTSSPGTAKPSPGRTSETGRENPDPEPQGTSSATAAPETTDADGPAGCRIDYDLVHQWPDGFQSTVTVTTREAVDSWRVAFTFRDGQRIRQMWDAEATQRGAQVTAAAPDYNTSIPAGGKATFGFIAAWSNTNAPPTAFTLNGRPCATG